MAKINVPLINPSYVVSLENKFQDLYKEITFFRAETNKQLNSLAERWNKLEQRVGRLEEFRDVSHREREQPPERKTGWAITCPFLDNSFIFCGRDGFQPISKVSDVLEKHGVRWVVWFEAHVDAEQCIKLAQLGNVCKVVQLDRETLEEVEGGE